MDDPLRVAQDETGDDEPGSPEEDTGSAAVRSRCAARCPEECGEEHECGGEQPGDLRAHLRPEEPRDPGRPPISGASGSAADDAPRLVPGEPAEAVVAEDQAEDAVVLRAAYVRPARGGPERDGGDPPARGDDERSSGCEQLTDSTPERRRGCDEIDESEARDDEERLQHLREEGQADEGADEEEPTGRGALERPRERIRGGDEHEGEQRVRVVEPEHEGRDRGERENEAREQAGARAEPAPHGRVQETDRGHAFEGLRGQDAPRVDAEQACGEVHHPERRGRLVDGDEVGGVERAEEERLPALRRRLHRG